MRTEDWLLLVYLAGCVFMVAASFISAARGNWQGDDQGALSLLVCWFWPLVVLFGLPQYVWLLIRYRSFSIAWDQVLR